MGMQKVNKLLSEEELVKVNELVFDVGNDVSFQFTDTNDTIKVFNRLTKEILFSKSKKV
jgi:hypothetical protein